MSFRDLVAAGALYTGRHDVGNALRLISSTLATQNNEIGFYGRFSAGQPATSPGRNAAIIVAHEEVPVNNSATMTFIVRNATVEVNALKFNPITNVTQFYMPTITLADTTTIAAATSLTLTGASSNLVLTAAGASITGANQTVKFSVKNASNASIFVVDTSASVVGIYGANNVSKFTVYDAAAAAAFNIDTTNKRIQLGKSGEVWTLNLYGGQGLTAGNLLTTDVNGNIVEFNNVYTGQTFENAELITPNLSGTNTDSIVQTDNSGALFASNTIIGATEIIGLNASSKFAVKNNSSAIIFNVNTTLSSVTVGGSLTAQATTIESTVNGGTFTGILIRNASGAASQNLSAIQLQGNNGTVAYNANLTVEARGLRSSTPLVSETTVVDGEAQNFIISNLNNAANATSSIAGYVGSTLRGRIAWGLTGNCIITPVNDLVLNGPNLSTLGALTRTANGVVNVVEIAQAATNLSLVQRTSAGGIAVFNLAAAAITGSSITLTGSSTGGFIGMTINNTAAGIPYAALRFISNNAVTEIGTTGTSNISSVEFVAPALRAQVVAPSTISTVLKLANFGTNGGVKLQMETIAGTGGLTYTGTSFDFDRAVRVSRSLTRAATQMIIQNLSTVDNTGSAELQMQAPGQNSPYTTITGTINYSYNGFTFNSRLMPSSSGSLTIGTIDTPWSNLYCGTITSSGQLRSTTSVNGESIGLSLSNINNVSNGATVVIEMQAASQNIPYSIQRGRIAYSWKGFSFERNIIPFSANLDIGSTTDRWGDLYCNVLNANETSYISTSSTNSEFVGLVIRNTTGISSASTSAIQMQAAGSPDPSTTLTGKITYSHRGFLFSKHILPSTDNATDLGASDIRWRDIYTHDLSVLGNLYIDDAAASSLLQTTSGRIVTASNTLPANCSATTMSLISPVLSSPTKYIQYTSLRTRYRTGGNPTTITAGICLSAFDESHFLLANTATTLNVIFTNANTTAPLMPGDVGYGTSGAVPVLNISSGGRIAVGSNGTAGLPAYSFIAHSNVGMYCENADDLRFATGGGLRIRLTTSNTIFYNNILPNDAVGTYNLGADGTRWDTVYANFINGDEKCTIAKTVNSANFLALELRNKSIASNTDSVTLRMTAPGLVPSGTASGNIKYDYLGFAIDSPMRLASTLSITTNATGALVVANAANFTMFNVNSTGVFSRTFLPLSGGTYDLGDPDKRWGTVYSISGSDISDVRAKSNITTLSSNEGLAFINNLRPVSYNLIDYKPTKKHFGLIAQELETTLASHGITDFGGVQVPNNPNSMYGMSYNEMIAPMIKAIQELSARLLALESA